MIQRREFLRRLGWGLAGGWAAGRWGMPRPAAAASPPHIAFLADAHLPDGNASRAEARALARAVAEIRGLESPPDLVLFAGDLAHDGNANALELGREILADLPGPLALVQGEGDGMGGGAAAWPRLFGEPRFSFAFSASSGNTSLLEPVERKGKRQTVFHLLGLHTALEPSPRGPVFAVGREQRGWLARELARLDPDLPLIVLSHAPLGQIFQPWGQWTRDGAEVLRLLSPFSRVYCFHGHVHNEAAGYKTSTFLRQTENEKRKTKNHPLPSTAWPLPSPLQGTPASPSAGLGPRGCGWILVSLENNCLQYEPRMWRG